MNTHSELVMLPGWGMPACIFDRLAARLAPALSVRQINLPGHGGSDDYRANGTLDSWVRSTLDQVRGTTWMGWSLGGVVAIRAALDHPQRLRRLVLLATGAAYPARENWPWGMDAGLLRRFIEDVDEAPAPALREFNGWQVAGSERARETLRILNAHVAQYPAANRALNDGLAILRDTDLRSYLASVGIPVLMVAGAEDRVVPAEAARETAALMPNAMLRLIPGAGHAAFLSHEAQVRDAVLEFIGRDLAA